MSGQQNDISMYVISLLTVSLALAFAFTFTGLNPGTVIGKIHGIIHHPVSVIVLACLFVFCVAGMIGQLLQGRRVREQAEQKMAQTAESLIRPTRSYVLSTTKKYIPMSDLSEISDKILRIARQGDSGIIDLVDYTISSALRAKASDIHIEPTYDKVSIKYRLDGMLHDVGEIPRELLTRFISRLRVLANLTIFQPGKPQDGRIDIRVEDKNFDVRLSILPTLHGDKAVIRLFETGDHGFILSNLGMSSEVLEKFTELLMKPEGTLFLTGPTGSGKTTTIYGAIRYILENRGETTNIVTIEDPIESEVQGINQTQVNPKRDLTFSTGLRSILRQDPDVIMVGEVRDSETARICTQAGLTGHLIISSVHADSSVGVFNRLIDMGIEPFLVASSVSGVMAQRLVRRNCPYCSEPTLPSLKSLKRLGISAEAQNEYMKGKGCSHCQNRGFLGRVGIFELLMVTPELREALQKKVATADLFDIAKRNGLVTLARDGIEKVQSGILDIDELSRVLS